MAKNNKKKMDKIYIDALSFLGAASIVVTIATILLLPEDMNIVSFMRNLLYIVLSFVAINGVKKRKFYAGPVGIVLSISVILFSYNIIFILFALIFILIDAILYMKSFAK